VKPSESSRPSNEKRKKKVIMMNRMMMIMMMMMIYMNYLALQINKSKIDAVVSEHYSTMNGSGYVF